MKKSANSLVYGLTEALFMFIMPCVLLWLEYGDSMVTVRYKISTTAVLFLILFFFLSKRFWLDESVKKMQQKITDLETLGLTTTDQAAIASMKQRYRQYCLIDLAIKSVVPLLVLVLAILAIKALQDQTIKLFGVFMYSTVSFGIGICIKIREIYARKFEHEE